MKPCNCIPQVSDPKFRAHLGTPGLCIYSPGSTEAEAISNLAKHAKKDRIPRVRWVEAWLETIQGEFVRDLDLSEVATAAKR